MSDVIVSKKRGGTFWRPTGWRYPIVILARGHGSGRVDRQWSNSDVSSGATTGSSLSFGLYGVVSFAALPLLRCVCSFAASYTVCSWGPCWLSDRCRGEMYFDIVPVYCHQTRKQRTPSTNRKQKRNRGDGGEGQAIQRVARVVRYDRPDTRTDRAGRLTEQAN